MITSETPSLGVRVGAMQVEFEGPLLHVRLTDGRIMTLPYLEIPWLGWLAAADDSARQHWVLEPGGFAVYWPDLDDGFEIEHILAVEPVA